ncbi:MAG: hypothetical protein MMC33_006695 [Icmadophila ericetorum]|nr:hypothetical protein [Icmadophila ericetorum]
MSRPLPNNPSNQPLGNRHYPGISPLPTGPPTSFKTNVNRAKTKRWVEAKSYSYDGDDWGDADEYDEYAGYDEPEPAVKPTGVRQQGQHSVSGSGYNAGGRSNSFNQEDERRVFSAGAAPYGGPPNVDGSPDQIPLRQGIPQGPSLRSLGDERYPAPPPANQPPIQGIQGTYQPGPLPASVIGRSSFSSQGSQPAASSQRFPPLSNVGPGSYAGPPRQYDNNGRTQSFTSNSFQGPPRQFDNSGRAQSITSSTSQDFQSRREFTPSGMPTPLVTRGSPSPSNSNDPRPPRKSSLAGEPRPLQSRISGPTETLSKPATQMLTTSISQPAQIAASSEETTAKLLPFVRPADIYKRMQEEREKERRSQETSRPSMDTIMRAESPAPKTPVQRPSSSGYSIPSESSIGPSSQARQSYELPGQEVGTRRARTPLDTVAERKSEYGMEGIAEKIPNPPRLPDVPHVSGFSDSLLPDVTRVSGFGESFLGSMSGGFGESMASEKQVERKELLLLPMARQPADEKLKRQPSPGFHSAIHQAFDDQVPQTPSSAAGSGLARTNSESTNGISPIMSRAPSTATAEVKAREAEAREANIPAIAEESPEISPRPMSGEPSTPTPIARKASPRLPATPSEAALKTFNPGHHRELSASPSSSPARSPALETSQQLHQSEKAELAMTTPIDKVFLGDANITPRQSASGLDGASDDNGFQESGTSAPTSEPPPVLRQDTEPSPLSGVLSDQATDSPVISPLSTTTETPRAESPSKNCVSGLAGKFGPQVVGGVIPSTFEPPVIRPENERMESFRPRLPGGWDSYASTGASTPQGLGIDSEPRAVTPTFKVSSEPTPIKLSNIPVSGKPQEKGVDAAGAKSSMAEALEPITAPDHFVSLATAGTALASALVAAVGLNREDSTTEKEEPSTTSARHNENTEIRSESRPWRSVFDDDDADSSVAPTPLPKDTPIRRETDQSMTSEPEYFPAIVPLRQKPRNSIVTDTPETPERPVLIPNMSTETSPHDYESDRLRKEIVRELSPHLEHDRNREGFGHSPTQMHESTRSPTQPRNQGHDSMTLPNEYESYWDELEEDDDPNTHSDMMDPKPDHQIEGQTPPLAEKSMPSIPVQLLPPMSEQSMPPKSEKLMPPMPEKLMPPVPEPLMPVAVEKSMPPIPEQPLPSVTQEVLTKRHQPTDSESSLKVSPNVLTHRFSWEPMPEVINSPTRPNAVQPMEPIERIDKTPSQEPISAAASTGLLRQPSSTSMPQKEVVTRESMRQSAGLSQPPTPAKSSEVSTDHFDDESDLSGQRTSLQLQKQISVPPERTDMPLPSIPAEQQKILTFAEIVALKDQTDRIQTFNSTRKQFADMNTGLSEWLSGTLRDLPEHSYLAENGGRFAGGSYTHKQTPSKSKLAGLRVSSGAAQQPYYQQYLNASASSPTTTGPATPPGQNMPFYQPSRSTGSKLTSAQVQAKSKDLLHSAGIFGGKANTAAKGFFSKGKQRFRSSGGGDKASSPPLSSLDPSRKGMQRTYLEPTEPGMQSAFSTTSPEPTSTSTLSSIPEPPSQAQSAQKTSPKLVEIRDSPVAAKSTSQKLDSRAIIGRVFSDATETEVPPISKSDPAPNTASQAAPRDHTPAFLEKIPSIESYGPSSAGLQSQKSATSSDKTPTQASFAKKYWRQGSDPSVEQATGTASKLPVPPQQQLTDGEQQTKRLSKYEKVTNAAIAGGDNLKPQAKSNEARPLPFYDKEIENDSGSSNRKGSSAADSVASEAEQSRTTDDSRGIYKGEDMREEIALKLLEAEAEATQGPPARLLQAPQYTVVGSIGKEHSTKHPEDISLRRPSADVRDPSFEGRPHSPVSPPQSLRDQPIQQAPIHYDTTHDFISQGPPSRDTPRSFSRPFQDPNLHQHPAFRQENLQVGSIDWPEEYYPEGTSRGDALPREQNTEFRLDGVGPPPAVEERSRNRRSFGPSTLLKRLSGTPASEGEPSHNQPTPAPAPAKTERKAKRGSFFKALTGEKVENDKKDSATSSPRRSQVEVPSNRQTQSSNRAEFVTNRQLSSSTTAESPVAPSANSSRSRLQRATTSSVAPALLETGKKKRFSGLGNLFSRSNQRQSTPPAPQPSYPAQSSPQSSPYNSFNNRVSPPNSVSAYHANRQISGMPVQQYATPPPVDRYAAPNPPLEGYYSPDRTSATFSPEFMSGQRSPRLVAQDTLPSNYQRNTQNTSTGTYPRNNQQPTMITPGQWDLNQQSRNESNQDSLSLAPPVSQSSWTRRAGRRSEGFPNSNAQPSQPLATGSPGFQRTSARPSQIYHEMGRSNTVARNDSPPPPPPPKDDWRGTSPTSATTQHRSTSAPLQTALRSSYTPTSTLPKHLQPSSSSQQRQTLPPLQTNVNTHARNVSREAPKIQTLEETRRTRQKEIEMGLTSPQHLIAPPKVERATRVNTDEERIVMSSSSYPGQEWQPGAGWDDE